MKFNEDSRVKIPSIPHLTRLGNDYRPLKKGINVKSLLNTQTIK